MTSKQQKPRATKKAAPATASETLPTAEVKPRVKAKAKAKAAMKPEKEKREPKGPLCVFALRMSPDERDRLHAAVPPARATRFARAVLIAFSLGDDAAFRQLVREAGEGRAKAAKK